MSEFPYVPLVIEVGFPSYDLIHVCQKRRSATETLSWAGIRQEVWKKAREELKAIEVGCYGGEPPSPTMSV